ncbi:MAG: sigma-70 family RNA polymerase sigma factor [Puniceicoccaceae bacterium]|nr:MAG: sigma-70 family RNA polymerase sigma factor [Puniceicoccaceae bacterium]
MPGSAADDSPGDTGPTGGGWLAGAKSGDQQAWSHAFEALWPIVLATASRTLPNPADAEEAAATALAHLQEKLALVGTEAECRALAVVIARRAAISKLRSLSAEKRGGGDAGIPLSHHPEIEARDATDAGLLLDLDAYLRTLPEEDRRRLELFFIEGFTSGEIAELENSPAATVRTRVFRTLEGLRKTSSRWEQIRNRAAPEGD